jgi:ATP-binding protein involved in chromosome partitioning
VVETNPSVAAAAREMAETPDDSDAQAALRFQLKKLLAADDQLAAALMQLLEASEQPTSYQAEVHGEGAAALGPGAVAAGKGGVGKSTVAVNLAVALADMGAKVGLLDADIFGPSVPLMLGVCDQPGAIERENGHISIIPLQAHGVKLISIGLLIDEDKPVIWRGPMITQLLQQFLFQVDWAPLDYLIVDLPPGTGDVPLTLAQTLPVTGALIVTTPQNVATADVIKAMQMFRHEKVNIPLLGIVENMAYFVAPDTGKRYDIFGQGGAERLAQQMDIPLLGQIPLGISVREGGDLGTPAILNDAPDAYAKLFRELAQQVAARVSILSAQVQAA